eukprot:2530895-Pyramimonas_sp.AAC.1
MAIRSLEEGVGERLSGIGLLILIYPEAQLHSLDCASLRATPSLHHATLRHTTSRHAATIPRHGQP